MISGPGTVAASFGRGSPEASETISDLVTVYEMSAQAVALARCAQNEVVPLLDKRLPVIVFNKKCLMPRNTGLFSLPDPNSKAAPFVKEYKFSRTAVPAKVAPPAATELIEKVNAEFGTKFNAILVNEYPAGDWSAIGAHGDNEKGLCTKEGGVFGISLYDAAFQGTPREMIFRERATNRKVRLPLMPSTIFSMTGPSFQTRITHEIPAMKRGAPWRLSFTFRQHETVSSGSASVSRKRKIGISGSGVEGGAVVE